jgi:predicted dehydrogenase
MRLEESDTLRVGIVGAGSLGRLIGGQFGPLAGTAVTALADVSSAARSAAAAELGVPEEARYADYATMLDAEPLDAVVISTPHALHDEHVTAALDRKLDVLCEKPLVLDVDRARALAGRVRDSGQVLMVGYQRHQDRAFVEARERYRDPDGPTVEFATAEITQDWFDAFDDSWRTDPELSGGGFLVDTGRHVVDALLWVTGLDPVGVTARMAFERPGIDRRAHLDIEFANGATASVSLYGDAVAVREAHHLWDGDGAAYVEGRQWGERDLSIVDTDGGEYEPYLDRSDARTKAEAFVDAIRTGERPPATPVDAVRTTAVVNAAYESAETGEQVGIDLSRFSTGRG